MNITISKIATRIAVCLIFMFSSIAISAVEEFTTTWSVLGNTSLLFPTSIEAGNSIGEFHTSDIVCNGQIFYGWTEDSSFTQTTEALTCINERTKPSTNTTNYAVFAENSQKEEATWDRTELDDIKSTDEVVIVVAYWSESLKKYYYYGLTYSESTGLVATLLEDINEYNITSNISDPLIWSIKNESNTINISQNNEYLYCTSNDVKVGSSNNHNFIVLNELLYNCEKNCYIGINFRSADAQPYWSISKSNIENQHVFFYKKNEIANNSLAIQIVEWKKDSIVVMYNGAADQDVQIYVNGNHVDTMLLSQYNIDAAIYEIPISILLEHTNKALDIVINEKKKTFVIPLIIKGNINANNLSGLASNTDIVIQKGGIFNAGNIHHNWGNIMIYGGGQMIVGPDCLLNANSITMRVGSVENGQYQAAYPQFVLQGKLGTVSNFYIDYLTTYDRYYALSIPYEVNTEDIHYPIDIYGENVSPDNKGSFTLQYYDGASRAERGLGWTDLKEPATLVPYTGYTFWGAPKNVSVNGAKKVRQKFGIHRLPIHNINTINETVTKNISVIAHGNEQTNDNDRGWNFLGNPYLGEYTGTIGDIRYITQTNDGKKYFSNEVANVTLDPFNTYFVQVDENQNIPFNILNSPYMQSPRKDKYDEISTGILLSCDEMVDRVGVLIADRYTENYDFNADLAKFDNHDLTIYAISKSGKLSYTAISPQTANQSIEIGYKVLEGNQFTFQFDNSRYEAQDIDILYLIDKELNVTTDLLQTDYSFYSDAGTYDQRFALDIRFHENNTTSIPQYSQEPSIILENQSLNISNLPVGTRVSIYNVLGHCFYQQAATSSELSIQLPRGYYILYINCAQGLHRTIFIQ